MAVNVTVAPLLTCDDIGAMKPDINRSFSSLSYSWRKKNDTNDNISLTSLLRNPAP